MIGYSLQAVTRIAKCAVRRYLHARTQARAGSCLPVFGCGLFALQERLHTDRWCCLFSGFPEAETPFSGSRGSLHTTNFASTGWPSTRMYSSRVDSSIDIPLSTEYCKVDEVLRWKPWIRIGTDQVPSINICAKREFHGSGGVWQVSKVVL